MPKLVGKHVSDVIGAIEQAGFPAPKVRIAPPAVSGFDASADEDSNVAKPGATKPDSPVGLIVRQSPAAGTKISQSTQITLEVAR